MAVHKGLLIFLFLVAPAPLAEARGAGSPAQTERMTVVMTDNRFTPEHLTFRAGQDYEVRLENRGKSLHEFTAPAFLKAATIQERRALSNGGTDVVVQPGQSVSLHLVAPPAGHYDFRCADHDWDGMIGDITVD